MTPEGRAQKARPETPAQLRPATAGGASFPSSELPGDSSVNFAVRQPPQGVGAGLPGTSGGRAAEGGREPKKHTRRNFLMGGLAALGLAAGGGTAARLATRSGDSQQPSSTPEATVPGGGVSPKTPEPATATPTVEPTPTPTPTPEPTQTPDPEGSHGNVGSIDALKLPEAQKEAINKMLEGSTPQIIVQLNGQTAIIAIADNMLNAESRQCPVAIGSSATMACPVLKSVAMNTGLFPDADERMVNLVEEAKYQAFKYKSGNTGISKEQYQTSGGNFLIHAEDVISGKSANYSVGKDSPFVLVITSSPDDNSNTVELNSAYSLAPQTGNGVIGARFYQRDAGVANFDSNKRQSYDIKFALNFLAVLTQFMDKTSLNIVGRGHSSFNGGQFADIGTKIFRPYTMDTDPETGILRDKTQYYPTIFITSGIPAVQ